MSVPGQSGLARFVKLPPVEEKKIVDIVKFEAKQQIPFPLDEVVWDYQKVSEGTVTDGFAMDTEIGLFAMKRDMISRFIGHFQSVKMEVHHVQMTPLALANYVTYDLLKRGGIDGEQPPAQTVGKKKCVVALDIGTEGSNLIITDGARIIWQRPIPVGGNHFTRALTKELKLTFAKAEHLKRNAAKSPELANILKALRPVLQEFVGEVQRSLGYFTNTHRDAQIEYMVGLGSAFKLPGLQKFLADKLSLEVRKTDKYARLTGPGVTDAPVFKENLLLVPRCLRAGAAGSGHCPDLQRTCCRRKSPSSARFARRSPTPLPPRPLFCSERPCWPMATRCRWPRCRTIALPRCSKKPNPSWARPRTWTTGQRQEEGN